MLKTVYVSYVPLAPFDPTKFKFSCENFVIYSMKDFYFIIIKVLLTKDGVIGLNTGQILFVIQELLRQFLDQRL